MSTIGKTAKTYLCFSGIILLYTAFFQAMYSWMRYDTITANVDIWSWLYSLLLNYVPILLLGLGTMCVCKKTLCIDNLAKKVAVDLLAVSGMLVIVNYLFSFVTGFSVNWGGTIFNSIMVLLGVEFWQLSIQKQRSLLRENLLAKENMAMRYEVQKSYVNPHFLYNTLDMLSSLIEDEKNEEAIQFVNRLSSYYRAMTGKINSRLSSFSEEMKSVGNYIEIVKYQFGDALSFSINNEGECDPKVIPFSIQLLVENVIKHNKITDSDPVRIEINVNKSGVSVANNSHPKDKANYKRTGIGLSYLKNVYSSYGRNIEVVESPDRFEVTLPNLEHVP